MGSISEEHLTDGGSKGPISVAGSRIEETKRHFVVELFIQRGQFWDLVRNMRVRRSIEPIVGLPKDQGIPLPLMPEDRPKWRDQGNVVPAANHPAEDAYERTIAHNREVIDFEQAWRQDLQQIVKQTVPAELRGSPMPGGGFLGIFSRAGNLSNEYGFWMRFVSLCVLYDPPETSLDSLEAFAGYVVLRPYQVKLLDADAGEVSMTAPPIKALSDPGQESAMVVSQTNLILDEINKRHLQPLGLDIREMWQDIEQNCPYTMAEVYRREELLQLRLYMQVDEQTTDEDFRAARRLIRAKQKRNRGLVSLVAKGAERRAILAEQHTNSPRSKSVRDPLRALQLAIIYYRLNQQDPEDRRRKSWTFKRLAATFNLGTWQTARNYVRDGEGLLRQKES